MQYIIWLMNNRSKINNWRGMLTVFIIVSVVIVTIITAYSSLLTQAINQAQAQTLNVTEKKSYITDVNVHFKTTCISIIVFTYCW